MGKYLDMYLSVENHIYQNNINQAKDELQALLNLIYSDMKQTSDIAEIVKAKIALTKLIPVLDELKKGVISDLVIKELKLDESKLKKEKFDKLEKTNKVNESEIIVEKPSVKADTIINEKDSNLNVNILNGKDKGSLVYERKPLTPQTLDDYIGQEKAKKVIQIAINAAKKEQRVLNHLLICSPYGLGKTTLANIIANEMNLPFFSINATNLKDTKSLSLYFSKIKENCIIFIDEIHSLKNDVQTLLLSILTDFKVSYIDESGCEKEYLLPSFTLIGATTQAGELLKPFLNRFAIVELEDYTDSEKEIIVKSKFDKLGYNVSDEVIKAVALRSRGIPRTIEIFVKGIKDIAINNETKEIDMDMVNTYFEMNGIDELGLNKNDIKILEALATAKVPLALITLESKTGIQKEDIAFRYEPFLIKLGLLEKTERGRVITQKGLDHLNISPSDEGLE